jgi:hypothetical protein
MLRHLDLVNNFAINEVFQRPGQMLWIDALHGRAHADCGGHELDDFVLWQNFFGKTVNQVQFGADQRVPSGASLMVLTMCSVEPT